MIYGAFALALLIGAPTDGGPRRMALLVGNNTGDSSRTELKYAEEDARQMGEVLSQLAGVSDPTLLLGGSAEDLDRSLEALSVLIADGQATTLFFYYSGHADSTALLMDGSRYSFSRLRQRLTGSKARLFVAIIDACESGSMIRAKGGRPVPIVDLDLSQLDRSLAGGVMLASTGPGESAQESDDIGGSYFTHYLVSGLRGGADVSGDGRVSLEEAYQFVYHHTLDRTRSSELGPQHPSYGVHIDGRGELVLTWHHEASSYLVLPESTNGTYFVRDKVRGRVVAEVEKQAGMELRIALSSGRYEVSRLDANRIWISEIDLPERSEHRFEPSKMTASALRSRQGKGSSTNLLVSVAYAFGTGYLIDADLRQGADLRLGWRPGPIEIGLSVGFSISRYRRGEAIDVALTELCAGGYVRVGRAISGDLRGDLGAEVRWVHAIQEGSNSVGEETKNGNVMPIGFTLGVAYPFANIEAFARLITGPVLLGEPDGLKAVFTFGGNLGVQYAF